MSRLDALHASCARLRTIGQGLRDADLVASAYPTEWTVADVFSHLGSSATIFGHFFDDVIESREPVEGRHQRIWDEWNAKAPSAHVEHCLIADGELLARLEASDEAQRAGFEFSMGPISVGFDGFVGLRLNEHAMHTWDIEVAFDPSATIPAAIADHVVDNLALTARFSGRAGDVARTVGVATTDTGQAFAVVVAHEVELEPARDVAAELTLPAEALCRLVYGRLDPAHTPPGVEGDALDFLRGVFGGV